MENISRGVVLKGKESYKGMVVQCDKAQKVSIDFGSWELTVDCEEHLMVEKSSRVKATDHN